jgi:hypothetical protein
VFHALQLLRSAVTERLVQPLMCKSRNLF